MAKKPKFVPTKEQQEKFNRLTKAEKIAAVRERMAAGDSNLDAAKALGATPGQIAGIRFKNDIPSKNEAPSMGAKKGSKSVPRSASASPKKAVAKPKAMPEPPGKPQPPFKLAASHFMACEDRWPDDRLCDYVKEEGSRYCKLHSWMRRQRQS